MLNKVMIISVSAGSGHVRAAQALEETFKLIAPSVQVLNIDALEYSEKAFRKLVADGYVNVSNRIPHLWGYMYDVTDKETTRLSFYSKVVRKLQSFSAKKMLSLIRKEKPDAIISTHFLPPPVLIRYFEKKKMDIPVYCVVTDFDIHNMWYASGIAGFFVASDLIAHKLKSWSVDPDKIHITGIPIHPVFKITHDREKLFQEYGLVPDQITFLLMGSGLKTKQVDGILRHITCNDSPKQILLVAGRNQKLMNKLEKFTVPPGTTLRTFGFVSDIEKLMSVADLIITKPGGLTVSECLVKNLPLLMVFPIPGQEDRNADYVISTGAGIKANDTLDLEFKIQNILENPGILKRMRESAAAAAHPAAADHIIRKILKEE
jgi:processive 1,2-diacylglycerol beta-glucosyltransferase